jgi:RNA recognition motif-containing protein
MAFLFFFAVVIKITLIKSLFHFLRNDYRIFCGDLGNEVSDQILANAFSKYQSLKKAKVIRDKNTGKSKGYGFVSLLDVNDYISAMREMNGKYVGNRPIKIKRSTWKDRSILYSKSKIETVKFKKKKQKMIQKQNKMQFNNNNNTISDNNGVVNNNNISSSNNNLN